MNVLRRLGTLGVVVVVVAALGACAPSKPPQAPTFTAKEIAEQSRTSVVVILVHQRDTREALGSGFVVSKDRIATNRHVVAGAREIAIVLADGTKRPAKGVWLSPDPTRDLAVLSVDTGGLKTLPLADSGGIHPGEHVVAVGHPKGLVFTVSDGIVSAVRDMDAPPVVGQVLQHTASMTHGNSGGPLFNDHGEVVGVNTWGAEQGNLSFALTANELVNVVRVDAPAQPLTVLAGLAEVGSSVAACGNKDSDVATCIAECDAGKAPSCILAGNLYRSGTKVGRDDTKSMALYHRACAHGSAFGCASVATLLHRGEGVAKDLPLARSLFEDACDRQVGYACFELAKMVRAGEGSAPNASRALALYDLACDAREPEAAACVEGGALAEKTRGPRRPERTVSFYERACDHGAAKGCTRLGELLTEPHVLARDEARAARMFERGCEKSDVQACSRLGAALVGGKGIAVDRDRGRKHLAWACANGAGASCDQVAALDHH